MCGMFILLINIFSNRWKKSKSTWKRTRNVSWTSYSSDSHSFNLFIVRAYQICTLCRTMDENHVSRSGPGRRSRQSVAYGRRSLIRLFLRCWCHIWTWCRLADPIELWTRNLSSRLLKMVKSGCPRADDDKDRLFMHAKAFEYLMKSGKLNCNVKFMIEEEKSVPESSQVLPGS